MMELGTSSLICLIASISFIKRYRKSRKFTLNSLAVAFVYNSMWTPAGIVHFLNFKGIGIKASSGLVTVIYRQAASLIGAASDLMTVVVRLSYRPIWSALLLPRAQDIPLIRAIRP
jgi:hypothetical protein